MMLWWMWPLSNAPSPEAEMSQKLKVDVGASNALDSEEVLWNKISGGFRSIRWVPNQLSSRFVPVSEPMW